MMRANRGARRSGRGPGRLAVLSTLLITTASLAHGVDPQTTGAASRPWVDGGVLFTTNFGLLVTADRCTQHRGFLEAP